MTTTIDRPLAPRPVAEPATPRTVRVSDARWQRAAELAKGEGLDISKVVNHYLQHYIDTADG